MMRVLATYVTIQSLGLIALPLAFTVCRQLPDRGTSIAKPLGLLMTGLTLWVGVSHGLLRNDLGGTVLAVALVAVASVAAGRGALARDAGGRRPLLAWLRSQTSMLLAQEAVFAVVGVAWAVVRAYDPAADHTEQPMDLMFVTASSFSPTLPLPDPWLAGYPVSYYYFGHWLVAVLGRLAGQPPEMAYTLGQATWYGLLALGCFGLVANLVRVHAPAARTRRVVAAGVLAAVTVALAGNLQGTLDLLQRAGLRLTALAAGRARHNFAPPSDHWWWWRSSRVLADVAADGTHVEVIDEFPAFSYVLGDDHPHVLAQPFVVLALALALNRFLARGRPRAVEGTLLVAVVAAIAFVNTADLPAVALLTLAATWAAARRDRGGTLTAIVALSVLAAGLVLLLAPFLMTAQGQVQGLLANATHPTPLWQLALMFGSLLPGAALLLDPATRARRRTLAFAVGLAMLGPLGAQAVVVASAGDARALAFARWTRDPWTLVVVSAFVGALAARLWAGGGTPAARATWVAAALGGALVLAPEIVYLHDGFGARMNTVFKLYYQAWLLWGLAAAFGLAIAWDHASGARRWLARGGTVAASLGLVFTAAAVWDVTSGFSSASPTFDALANVPADERSAIEWVRASLPADARVLQTVGRSYAADESRLSVATGRPTLLGWDGHELQWRGRAYGTMAAGRAEAAQAVYGAPDRAALLATLDAWRIRYVFVGPAERRRYQMDDAVLQRLRDALDIAFEQGDARIYRRRALE